MPAAAASSTVYKVTLSLLQLYFLMFSFTVERSYCAAPITAESNTGILVQETYDFCQQYNPYFLSRPEWLRRATCFHGYYFFIFYGLILIGLWHENIWQFFRPYYLLGLGAKLYMLMFYHYVVFTSDLPPPNSLIYFAVEGPYLVSISAILYQLLVWDERKRNNDDDDKRRSSSSSMKKKNIPANKRE
jgi:hypothetical protein